MCNEVMVMSYIPPHLNHIVRIYVVMYR